MPVTDPLQGATFLPAWLDPYNMPQTIADMYQFLLDRGIPRFGTKAELEGAYPAPVAGKLGFADGVLWVADSDGDFQLLWSEPIDWTGSGLAAGSGVSTSNVQYSVDSLGRVSWSGELFGASTPAENAVVLTFPATIAPAARKAYDLGGLGGSAILFVGNYTSGALLTQLRFRRLTSGGWPSSGVLGVSLAGLHWTRPAPAV